MIAEEELRAAARSGGSFKNNAPVLFINIPSKKFQGFLLEGSRFLPKPFSERQSRLQQGKGEHGTTAELPCSFVCVSGDLSCEANRRTN